MYLVKTPQFIQNLFPNFVWSIPGDEKRVFLTFDDGPIPEVTPWVLETLDAYRAKATFFCVGDNVRKHPDVFESVLEKGHQVGNHTYNHLNGWSSENIPYFHNIRHCANMIHTDLFRPPYGRMKPKQAQFLQRHYNIVMWDVLSGDFDANISPEQCLQNVLNNVKNGSIIVFHDSIKAGEKLRFVLPEVLKQLQSEGYAFESITEEVLSSTRQYLR
ncbi:MAG: polysaccharide deacetylase family protein, partial [Phaeodactylibacter sp.]|nr:polysaccharide deacetylase family protein [Phaeodactylibacter sp.]